MRKFCWFLPAAVYEKSIDSALVRQRPYSKELRKAICLYVEQEEEEKSKPTPPPPAARGRGRGGGGGRGRGSAGGATEEEEEAEEETPRRGAAGGRGQKRKQQQQDVSTHCQISDFHHTLMSLLTHLSKIIPPFDSEFLTQDGYICSSFTLLHVFENSLLAT